MPNGPSPTSIAQVRQLAQQMANNPADAVALGAQLGSLIRDLPPDRATLLSRPHFERATLWVYGVSFENVEIASASEAPPQIIRLQHDIWLRGIEAQVILKHEDSETLEFFKLAQLSFGTNNRAFVECNWRVDARQGFVSDGQAEILQDALSITGDGQFSAAIDWRLQKDQTIEVRLRSKLLELLGPANVGEDGPFEDMRMRWAVITFWGEALRQPSVQ